MDEFIKKWDDIKEMVKQSLSLQTPAYNFFVKPLKIGKVTDDTIYIIVTKFIAQAPSGTEKTMEKYTPYFSQGFELLFQKKYNIVYIGEEDIDKLNENNKTNVIENNQDIPEDKFKNDRIINANLNPKYTFDEFIVGESNEFAYGASLAVAEQPGEDIYNPLFLYGEPGLGKTHLMQAVGNYILESNPNMKVLYITAQAFTNEVVESIRTGKMNKLREKYNSIDVLMIDDVQFIIGKDQTQSEFFEIFNNLREWKKQIILTSDKNPSKLETLEERLRSRFKGGILADIKSPKYEMRVAILKKNAQKSGVIIDDEAYEYIATNIQSNIRELEGALNNVIGKSKIGNNNHITLYQVQEAVQDFLDSNEKSIITPNIIMKEICKRFNTTPEVLSSDKRGADIVKPRQLFMYLCKQYTNYNFKQIGTFIGNRDHSTVHHGYNKVVKNLETNGDMVELIEEFKDLLNL